MHGEPIFIEALTGSLSSAGMVPPGAEALVKSPGGVSPRPQSVLTVQSMAPIIPHLLYGHTDVYRRYGVKIKALMDVKGRASVERSAASNHVCKVHNPLGDDTRHPFCFACTCTLLLQGG